MIKFLNKVGKLLGEDKLRGDGSGKFGKTPDEIAGEHEEMQRKLWSLKPGDPQYAMVSRQVEELAKKRWGN